MNNKQEIKNHLLNNIDNFIGKKSKEIIPALFPVSKVGNDVENEAHCLWWNLPFLSYLGDSPITKINLQVIKKEIREV